MNHIIGMIRLVEQMDFENSVGNAFAAVLELEKKVGPLHKKLNMFKNSQEKDSLQKLIDATEKLLKEAEKSALKEIVKAYELFCTYFVGKACTQWDKVV